MIRAVILDAYGTIFSTGTGSVDMMTEILRLNGRSELDPKKVYARFKQLHREHMGALTGFITEAEVFALDMKSLSEEYGLERDPAEDVKIMLSIQGTRSAFPDSRPAIERMQLLLPVVIGSTTDTWPLTADLERAGIRPEKVFTSESLRLYKPSEGFYGAILEELDLRPEEALFAGDSLTDDVLGPARAGMKTCWIRRKGELLKETDPQPDYTAADLEELADIVEAQFCWV
ncbi:MAG: HAD family hydrolase [Firmicutes bacterium]|nr:HAD family hydrolase [Bacillota bacterium]